MRMRGSPANRRSGVQCARHRPRNAGDRSPRGRRRPRPSPFSANLMLRIWGAGDRRPRRRPKPTRAAGRLDIKGQLDLSNVPLEGPSDPKSRSPEFGECPSGEAPPPLPLPGSPNLDGRAPCIKRAPHPWPPPAPSPTDPPHAVPAPQTRSGPKNGTTGGPSAEKEKKHKKNTNKTKHVEKTTIHWVLWSVGDFLKWSRHGTSKIRSKAKDRAQKWVVVQIRALGTAFVADFCFGLIAPRPPADAKTETARGGRALRRRHNQQIEAAIARDKILFFSLPRSLSPLLSSLPLSLSLFRVPSLSLFRQDRKNGFGRTRCLRGATPLPRRPAQTPRRKSDRPMRRSKSPNTTESMPSHGVPKECCGCEGRPKHGHPDDKATCSEWCGPSYTDLTRCTT